MHRFQKTGVKSDSDKDFTRSTRYEDQELIKCDNEKQKLDHLSYNIEIEIELSSANIMKMERLQERYFYDGMLANVANAVGYYMRYQEAYERLGRLIEARYAPFHPVTNSGTMDANRG
jgi:hypothetical protein